MVVVGATVVGATVVGGAVFGARVGDGVDGEVPGGAVVPPPVDEGPAEVVVEAVFEELLHAAVTTENAPSESSWRRESIPSACPGRERRDESGRIRVGCMDGSGGRGSSVGRRPP